MRWAGKIGYTQNTEIKPGIWDDVITEVSAMGDLVQTTEVLRSEGVLGETATTTSISVVTDGKRVPLNKIKYVTFDGVRWQIASMVRQPPRLVIYLGEEYNGPLPEPAPVEP